MRSTSAFGSVVLGLLTSAALVGCDSGAANPAPVDASTVVDVGVAPGADAPAVSDLGLAPMDGPAVATDTPVVAADAGPAPCIPDRAQWDSTIRGHVQRQCGTCHGAEPNYGAPFSLLDYDANLAGEPGARHVDRIAANLIANRMPPAGTPAPTDDIRNTMVQWATCGAQMAPAGTGLRVSAPVFRSPEMAPAGLEHFDLLADNYPVGPTVTDDYRCFVFDAPVTASRFIRRFEIRLDQARVVHHVVLLRDPMRRSPNSTYSCFNMPDGSEYAYAWAPGQDALQFPEGGLRVNPGERYVMQIHYNNGARLPDITDHTGVRVFHSAPGGTEWGMVAIGPNGFSVPPRSTGTAESACTLGAGSRMLAGMPHMHTIGTDFEQTIVRSSGDVQPLISLQGWRFETELFYDLPVTFGMGDRIITRCTFNNTSSRSVNSGVRTTDEMCFNFAYVTPVPVFRFCDEAVRLVTDVTYTPSRCAPPGAATMLPLVTSPVRIGAPPALAGGTIPNGHWELAGIEYWIDNERTPLGTISRTETNLRGRGQLWTDTGRIISDVNSVVNLVSTIGARYSQPVNLQFTSTYTGTASTPLSLTRECAGDGSDVPSRVQYEVDGERLVVGLETINYSGMMITPRYIFRRDG